MKQELHMYLTLMLFIIQWIITLEQNPLPTNEVLLCTLIAFSFSMAYLTSGMIILIIEKIFKK
jgi:hypothetical protein